jgi:hypothetical protein
MLRSLGQDQERAAQVRADDCVEELHIAVDNRRKRHNAGIVDYDVYAA